MTVLFKDGTLVNPPLNPLQEKWNKLYPSCATQIDDYYRCMWCDKCPNGEHWKCPDEDTAAYQVWRFEIDQYYEVHGGFENVIMPFNIRIQGDE